MIKVRPVMANKPLTSPVSETGILLIESISSPTSNTPVLAAGYPIITSLIVLPSVTIPNCSLLLRDNVTKNVDFISEKDYKLFELM